MHDQPQLSQTTQVKRLTKGPSWRLTLLHHKKSGAWLHALPISSIGLRMDNEVVRIAVGLCLGVPLCQPHTTAVGVKQRSTSCMATLYIAWPFCTHQPCINAAVVI